MAAENLLDAGGKTGARTVLGSIAFMGGAQIARLSLQVLATAILARLLSPGDFGLVALAMTVTGAFAVLADAGLSYPVIQREDITQEQVSSLFWASLCLGTAMTAILWMIGGAVADSYGDPRLSSIMTALAFGFAISASCVQQRAIMARRMRFGKLALIGLGSMAAGVATGIGMAARDWGPWSLVGQALVSQSAEAACLWAIANWRPSRPRWAPGTWQMVISGGRLGSFNVVNHFARNADNFLIGTCLGNAALGLYSKSYQLIMLPLQQVSGPVSSVTVPALSRLSGEPARFRAAHGRALTQLLMACYPAYAFLAVTSGDLVLVMLGPQWARAADIFLILAASAVAQPICNSAGWLYLSTDRTGAMLRNGCFNSACLVAAFAAGLKWGPEGVAAAYSATLIALTPWVVTCACRNTPVSRLDVLRACLPGALGGTAMALGAWLAVHNRDLFGHGVTTLVWAGAVGSVLTVAAYLAVPMARRELVMLARHVPFPMRRGRPSAIG